MGNDCGAESNRLTSPSTATEPHENGVVHRPVAVLPQVGQHFLAQRRGTAEHGELLARVPPARRRMVQHHGERGLIAEGALIQIVSAHTAHFNAVEPEAVHCPAQWPHGGVGEF